MIIRLALTRRTLFFLTLSTALVGPFFQVHADTAPVPEVEKKELIDKLLTLQRGLIEGIADGLLQQPVNQLLQQAHTALQSRVAPEKRDNLNKSVREDIQKFLDEATPLVRNKAILAAPSTLGSLLEEKFSPDELKQLIAIIESPVNRKLNEMGPEMQQRLTEKIISDARPEIELQIRNLQNRLAKRFAVGSSNEAPAAEPSALPLKPSKKLTPATKPTAE